jgi:hypothetical protein
MKSINQMSAAEYKEHLLAHPEEVEQEIQQQSASRRVVYRGGCYVYEDGLPVSTSTSGEQTQGPPSRTKAAYDRPLI